MHKNRVGPPGLRRYVRPEIRNRSDLSTYVLRISVGCILVAGLLDSTFGLALGVPPAEVARSAVIAMAITAAIILPLMRVIGEAHLELFLAKEELDSLSRRDPLTGLYNRREMRARVQAAGDQSILVAVGDIDRFKAINDTHGHAAGDAVIRHVAQVFAGEMAQFGSVCRTGGEEFALIAVEADVERIRRGIHRVMAQLAATPLTIDDATITISLSMGVAAGENASRFDRIYAEADRALYVAKASGRARIEFGPSLMPPQPDDPIDPDEIVWSSDLEAETPALRLSA